VKSELLVGAKRVRLERAIWVVDLIAYLVLAVAGVGAAVDPSEYVQRTVQFEWALWVWGFLLAGGGAVAFIGRLSRVWALEFPANVAAGWGAALYGLILVPTIQSGGSLALAAIVVVAGLFVLRRYIELKIFTNEPGVDSIRKRLDAAFRRRTKNIVPRMHY